MAWSIDISTADTTVANQVTFQSYDSSNGLPLLVRLHGSGLQTDGNGALVGGTITHMELIDQSAGGGVLQIVTMVGGLPAAEVGALLTGAQALSMELSGWGFQGVEQEPEFTSELITLFGTDGERIEIAGEDFVVGGYLGTATSITHYDSGNNVLHRVPPTGNFSESIYEVALALSADEALYAYLTRGANEVTGNPGNFWELDGGLGNDTISGPVGSGAMVSYDSNTTGGVVVDLTSNTASGGGGNDTLVNISSVFGSEYGDSITGNSGANNLQGSDGNDTLAGLGGTDFLQGDWGDDSLSGGDGDDQVFGNEGNDTLTGGAGTNHLEGQGGSDVYVLTREGQITFVRSFGARVFEGFLSGESVVPGVSSDADGYAQLVLARDQSSANIFINTFGVDLNGAQTSGTTTDDVTSLALRVGSPTQNGAVVFGLIGPTNNLDGDQFIFASSGSSFAQAQVEWDANEGAGTTLPAQVANLTAGNLYVEVRTNGHPSGEIRGQLVEVGPGSVDKVDLRGLNIGSMEAVSNIISDSFDGARIFTQLNGVQSIMTLAELTESQLTAADFILTTATTAETFTGGANIDDLFGAGGNDTIHGGGNSDRLFGEAGDDFLDGDAGGDNVFGGAGADLLRGLTDGDWLLGGADGDELVGDGPVLETANALSIERLYLATLGRAPDDGGQVHWTDQLDAGTTLLSIAGEFVNSAEFQLRYGALNNTDFVTLLYNNVLDRAPDPGGLNDWVSQLNGGTTRAAVVTGFSESAEFKINTDHTSHAGQVYRLYGATLDRAPDAVGFEGWVNSFDSGTSLVEAAGGFIVSPEFQLTYGSLDNTQFVTLLYNNVLDRAPDQGGLDHWVGLLNGGATRASVVVGFSDSAEYQQSTNAALNSFMRSALPTWQDTVDGGAGDDHGSAGRGSDIFVFRAGEAGADHVYELETWDTLRFTGFGYADAAAALSHVSVSGSNVVFNDQGSTITFHDTSLSTLQQTGWLFT